METWGDGDAGLPEAGIVEAARQSRQGTFRGWKLDERLLRYLWRHQHGTPFEFAGAIFEVEAPIFVARQWFRHRVFSFNEASARYGDLPTATYSPTLERLRRAARSKQQKGKDVAEPDLESAEQVIIDGNEAAVGAVQDAIGNGAPYELARLPGPVSQYTYFRVAGNLRAWLGFLDQRLHPHAQHEMRSYAECIEITLACQFPRTMKAWREDRSTVRELRRMLDLPPGASSHEILTKALVALYHNPPGPEGPIKESK